VFIDRQLKGPYGSADGLYRLGPFVRGTKEQGPLDFRSKHPEMLGEPVEQLPLCCIGCEVADQFALANLHPEPSRCAFMSRMSIPYAGQRT
jgi:gluconate 2-dehydrogenase gamma chain